MHLNKRYPREKHRFITKVNHHSLHLPSSHILLQINMRKKFMKTFKEKSPRILFSQFLFFNHSLRWFLVIPPSFIYTSNYIYCFEKKTLLLVPLNCSSSIGKTSTTTSASSLVKLLCQWRRVEDRFKNQRFVLSS
jgi:hypothetical protein